MGFSVWGLGLRVEGLGFRVEEKVLPVKTLFEGGGVGFGVA